MLLLREKISKTPNLFISYTAIMTAIVFIFTVVFSLYIPETKGYFNIGETGVYIAAITGGPIVGGIAGGIGSALSDVALGYTYYAPVTLVVKGVEGILVGYLAIIIPKILGRNRAMGIAIGLVLSAAMYVLGTTFYLGPAEVTIGVVKPLNLTVTLNQAVWIIGAILTLAIIIALTILKQEYVAYGLATLTGGLEMVLGYFLYEQVVYGPGAIAEVPFNIMQMIIGTILSLTILGTLTRLWSSGPKESL